MVSSKRNRADGAHAGTTDRLWLPIFTIKRRKTWRDCIFAPITIPIAVLAFGTYIALCGPVVVTFCLIENAVRHKRERLRLAHFQKQGRFVTWKGLQQHLEDGEGVLVIERAGDCWWIPEPPSSIRPELVRMDSFQNAHVVLDEPAFRARYLDTDHGIACYVAECEVSVSGLSEQFPRVPTLVLLGPLPTTVRAN